MGWFPSSLLRRATRPPAWTSRARRRGASRVRPKTCEERGEWGEGSSLRRDSGGIDAGPNTNAGG